MPKDQAKAPKEKVELYEKVIAVVPGVERKGAALPYTSTNGNMFSLLDPTGTLGIRLPDDEKEKFEKKYKSKPFIQYGATMRGYVTVPASLLTNTAVLKKYFKISYEYAKKLKKKIGPAQNFQAGRMQS